MRPHSNLFPHYPLVHLTVSFSAGICTSPYCSLKLSIIAGMLCTALTLLLFIKQRLSPAALMLSTAMFFTGAVLADLERRTDESSNRTIVNWGS